MEDFAFALFPSRRLYCLDCKMEVDALPYWLKNDETSVDWVCQKCIKPIENVVLRRGTKLTDYLQKVREDELPLF